MSAVQPQHGRRPDPDDGHAARRVIATVLFPWMTAKFLFKPRVGPLRKDRMLNRLAFWRSVVGLGVILIATSRYQDVWANIIRKAMETGRLALVLLPLPILVIFIVTRSGHRIQLLPGVLLLIGRAALALTFFYLPIVLIFAAAGELSIDSLANGDAQFQRDIDVNASGAAALWLLAAIGLAFVLVPWFLCFWYCTIYWAARTGFWMGDIHPLLAPIGTTSLMLLISGQEIIARDTNGVPDWLWLMLNLCGAATALVLAIFEYRHLRSTGYRFRNGPEPAATDSDSRTADVEVEIGTAGPATAPPIAGTPIRLHE
ncbi:hypothetical protein ETD86_18960 [Nonomuraea turkmeniaca]|uniref:Uncharacterized protein n=1 Tax=Nonomuraea turkmeniaca TaxID=103838 RepID=A0A5S4FIC1_9ACTN|nr:hypothetical protein [Nonomuraea turkmeniaca]TMR20254.1 hypothetical protein ETD86_18960 [Nonomuraea turkmeniaca]